MTQKRVYTPEQMEALSKYEHDLLTATRYDYTMPVSAAGVRQIAEIYEKATGIRKRDTASCGYCVLDLMRCAGRLYFEQKKATEASTQAAGTTEQPEAENAGNDETTHNQEPEETPAPDQDEKPKGKGKRK